MYTGRYLVANANIKAGAKILECEPLVFGPPLEGSAWTCLSCNSKIKNKVILY
jgi:hypothetical protein